MRVAPLYNVANQPYSQNSIARWAILGGTDVVIELPTLYSLGSAQLFGTGAVQLIKSLSIDTLSFGSETTDFKSTHPYG